MLNLPMGRRGFLAGGVAGLGSLAFGGFAFGQAKAIPVRVANAAGNVNLALHQMMIDMKFLQEFGLEPNVITVEDGSKIVGGLVGGDLDLSTMSGFGQIFPAIEKGGKMKVLGGAMLLPSLALFTGKDNHILHDMHEVPTWVKLSPFVAMVLGFALSWLFYVKNPRLPVALAESQPILYRFLLNKWYFDELYDFLFVRPAKAIGRCLWKKGDGVVIDGLGPDGISARVVDVTHAVVRLQTGYIYHYAFAMLMGVALFVTWYMFGGAH